MQSSDLPSRISLPFAANAGGAYIRTIPQTTATTGRASFDEGFPPETFLDEGAGGIPPDGRDFNGILNQLSAWARWQASGGSIVYNSAFATAIGGYPAGAVLASTTPGLFWRSTANDNMTDPDGVGSANWVSNGALAASSAQIITGTSNTVFATPLGLAQAIGAGNQESIRLPGGKIEKDGSLVQTMTGGISYIVTFETPFPNACRCVSLTGLNFTASGARDNFPQLVSRYANGFTFVIQGTSTGGSDTLDGIDWIARGY